MAKAKKKLEPMYKKPTKIKVGDLVYVDFIGVTHLCKVLKLEQRATWGLPRWVFKCQDVSHSPSKGWIIPFVGVNNSEQYANIIRKAE